MSVAERPPVQTLRERAIAAWGDRQAEEARRRANEIEQRRRMLLGEVNHLAETVLGMQAPPRSVELIGTDDEWLHHLEACRARFSVDGERFMVAQYEEAPTCWGLFYVPAACPVCGFEPGEKYLEALADLGWAIENAPTLCAGSH